MSRKDASSRNKSYVGRITFLVIVLILLMIILIMLLKGSIQDTVAKKVTETAVEKIISSQTGEDVDLGKIKESMSEEDAQEFEHLMEEYATSENVGEAVDTLKNSDGDLNAVKDALSDKVSEEDMQKLAELYKKYKPAQ